MTKPTTARFGKFSVKIGNSASPIVYAAPCGFNSKSLTLTKSLTEINIPDCNDPDQVAWIARDAASLSASISGEGVMAAESASTWLDAWEDFDAVPIKVELVFGVTVITWTGYALVSSVTIGAEQGGRVTANVEMQTDGELERVTHNSGVPAGYSRTTYNGDPVTFNGSIVFDDGLNFYYERAA